MLIKPLTMIWSAMDGKKTAVGAIASAPLFVDSVAKALENPNEQSIGIALAQLLLYTGVIDKLRKQIKAH